MLKLKSQSSRYFISTVMVFLVACAVIPKETGESFGSTNTANGSDMVLLMDGETTVEPGYATPGPQPEITAVKNSYYVSTNGKDTNPGTEAEPWLTFQKAVSNAAPGDVVFFRGGVYSEPIEITRSGTSELPIHFAAYPGETVIIDGNNRLPYSFRGLVNITGSWVKITGFEVRNSEFMGVALFGRHVTASHLYVHHNQRNGILIAGDYGTVEYSQVWRNSLFNEFNEGGSNDSGLSAARDLVNGITDFAVIRGNIVWENWGEGISSYEANGTVIENNISHDNLSTNIYLSDSTNVLCDRNFVYMDPASYINGYSAHVGIMMGDERYSPESAHIRVTNNIAIGNHRNFYWWQGVQGGGMDDVLIANNTFVNSSRVSNVVILNGNHRNVTFANNIILQDGLLPVILTSNNPNINFSNNLWSKIPDYTVLSKSDVIGDPRLARIGSPYTPDWFRLLKKSPAVGKGNSFYKITQDFFAKTRDSSPDLGAIEYIH